MTLSNLLTLGNLGWLALGALFLVLFWASNTIRYIPNNRVGIVEKLWSLARLGQERLHRAAAARPASSPRCCAAAGTSSCRSSTACTCMPLVTIPQGKIGYVFARDGEPLPPDADAGLATPRPRDFQDARAFLAQRRPARPAAPDPARGHLRHQPRAVRRHHRGRASTTCRSTRGRGRPFHAHGAASIAERGGFEPVVIKGADDAIGIVTVHDGPSLPQGEIIAPTVGDDPADAGDLPQQLPGPGALPRRRRPARPPAPGAGRGHLLHQPPVRDGRDDPQDRRRGRQRRRGRLVHRRARARTSPATEYTHGELVATGERGVWSEPLLPGKYAFNTYAGKVIMVPTTNFILKWISGEVGAHQFDENLTEVSLITKDAFEPSLPLSVVVHIDYQQGAARHPALRRHQAAGRADARPDGLGLLQEHRPDAHAHPAASRSAATSSSIAGERDEGEVRALQPRAAGGADRHARPSRAGRQADRADPRPSCARARSPRSRSRPTRGRRRPRSRSASCARPRRAPSSRPRSPSPSSSITGPGATRARPSTSARCSRRRRSSALAEAEAEKVRLLGEGEAQRVQGAGRGRGRAGGARRHRAGDGDRGAGARLRRPAAPAHAAGDEPLRRGRSSRPGWTWCRRSW